MLTPLLKSTCYPKCCMHAKRLKVCEAKTLWSSAILKSSYEGEYRNSKKKKSKLLLNFFYMNYPYGQPTPGKKLISYCQEDNFHKNKMLNENTVPHHWQTKSTQLNYRLSKTKLQTQTQPQPNRRNYTQYLKKSLHLFPIILSVNKTKKR